MPDQASDLRRLMTERSRREGNRLVAHCQRPVADCQSSVAHRQRIVVSGGKGGVGTTTVATQLALACDPGKTLLVDADPRGGDIALRCGCDDRCNLGEWFSGRLRLEETIQEGPGGVQTLFGARRDISSDFTSAGWADRFWEAIDQSGSAVDVDMIILDLGNIRCPRSRRFWQTADAAIMVAATESSSLVGAYEAIKEMTEPERPPVTLALVNMAAKPELALDYCQRLMHACRRFLGLQIASAGQFPWIASRFLDNNFASKLQKNAKLAMRACRKAMEPCHTIQFCRQKQIQTPAVSFGPCCL